LVIDNFLTWSTVAFSNKVEVPPNPRIMNQFFFIVFPGEWMIYHPLGFKLIRLRLWECGAIFGQFFQDKIGFRVQSRRDSLRHR